MSDETATDVTDTPASTAANAAGPDATAGGAIPGTLLTDDAWLAERVTDTCRRWGLDDARTGGTLWWYSASAILLERAPALLLSGSGAPDPAPAQLTVSLTSYGYLRSPRASLTIEGTDAYAAALGPAFEQVIAPLARVSGAGVRALWAIASDSLANRTIRAGREADRVGDAGALAARLALPPFLPPRVADMTPDGGPHPAAAADPAPPAGARIVRRSSCCLIYCAPGQDKCVSCPRRTPRHRAEVLRRWFDAR